MHSGAGFYARRIIAAGWILLAQWLALGGAIHAGVSSPPIDLTKLSLEELMDIEVTLVSRKKEKLFETAAAAFVLTQEDIRRSGVTSIAEALRLVPGMVVARIDANKWAVSARGFNGRFAQKLLVLIDGRSAYTPLFSGVFWEVQDVLLEDVERIEVIRGPGATLWGSNAVNGVINIATRSAQDSQGGMAVVGGGTEERAVGQLRYGGRLGEDAYYRVYGKYFDRDAFVDAEGQDGADEWHMARGGLRLDWQADERNTLTTQGDIYGGGTGQRYRFAALEPPYQRVVDDETQRAGGNILVRWEHLNSAKSDLALQVYYDRTEWDDVLMQEIRDTYDVDFQHRFALSARQEVVWGWGYRHTRDATRGGFEFSLEPARRGVNFFSFFAQDNIALTDRKLRLIAGGKFEYNDYTGFEYQPNARLLWTPQPEQTAWAAVSRAVRLPSRADDDVRLAFLTLPPGTILDNTLPAMVVGMGDRQMKAEKLHAFEAGYRFRPRPDLLF